LSEVRIAVLASGSGTNFQALLDADLSPGKIVLLVCNNPGAKAIERAERARVPVAVIDHRTFASREDFDRAVLERVTEARAQWLVFAGFMRVVTKVLLEPFHHRVVNVHPALLPAFPGVNAQKQAFDAGVKITGCTVHLVDAGVDTGPILAQAAVPVLPTDDLDSLRERILKEEHRLLPQVVRALAEGRLKTRAGRPVLE
jgi:phosphoribosylglycinamide formyltransferase-1